MHYQHFMSKNLRSFFIIVGTLFLTLTSLNAQECPEEELFFNSQAEIDQFIIDYPNCTNFLYKITVSGSDVTNLDGLENLESIVELDIFNNDILSNLDGLNNLLNIESGLFIGFNSSLESINGLANLSHVGSGIDIEVNQSLTSIEGLTNLETAAYLSIKFNDVLASINGFTSLMSLGIDLIISYNPSLQSINGLSNLTEISTQGFGYIEITENNMLTNINGLSGLQEIPVEGFLIWANQNLSNCCVLSALININTNAFAIELNAEGCNSQENILESCIDGCTDESACNFDPDATQDDGSCIFPSNCNDCDGNGGLTNNPEAGDSCDDNDETTENDLIQADCTCAGTPIECVQPTFVINTMCLDEGGFTIEIIVEQSVNAITMVIFDNLSTIPSIVNSEEGVFTYGIYEDNTAVELSIAAGINCEAYTISLTDDCEDVIIPCTLEAIPNIICSDNGTYTVITTVNGGSGNYSYVFSESGNYEELNGSTEAGFVSGDYTDGEAYFISVIDNETDCEVVLENTVECTKTAIDLLSFEGRANKNGHQLFWTTASEINNNYFKIMRSENGYDFEQIGSVNGAGNSNIPVNYEYTDSKINANRCFYRIDAVDFDGIVSQSKVIELFNYEYRAVTLVPNPATNIVNIQTNFDTDISISISLYDTQGKLLIKKKVENSLNRTIQLDISTLISGLYFIQLEGEEIQQRASLIVD